MQVQIGQVWQYNDFRCNGVEEITILITDIHFKHNDQKSYSVIILDSDSEASDIGKYYPNRFWTLEYCSEWKRLV